MPIISKETWDKFTQEEKEKILKKYQYFHKVAYHGAMESYETLFPEESLQPKPLTYEDVARELFNDKMTTWICSKGTMYKNLGNENNCTDATNVTSEKQAEKLLAINKLLNVAKLLNGNWKPNWSIDREVKFYLKEVDGHIGIDSVWNEKAYYVYFRTEELAKQAIKILGEDTVRLSLTTEY